MSGHFVDVSVVIPVFKGGMPLRNLCEEIHHVFFKELGASYEIILVSDCAPCGFSVIEEICNTWPFVVGIELKKRVGQQKATYVGLHVAKGNIVITADDDGQHAPKDMSKILSVISDSADLVYGFYEGTEDSKNLLRRKGSAMVCSFFQRHHSHLGNGKVTSFRAIKKELVQKILNKEKRFLYLSWELLEKTKKVKVISLMKKKPHKKEKISSGYKLVRLVLLFLQLFFHYGAVGKFFCKVGWSNKGEQPIDLIHRVIDKREEKDIARYDTWRRRKSNSCHSPSY